MDGNEYEYYIAAKKKEISQLVKQETWEGVNYNDMPPEPDGIKISVFSSVPGHSSLNSYLATFLSNIKLSIVCTGIFKQQVLTTSKPTHT